MKKTISLVGMGLLFVSLVMMSCAPVQKTMLTKNSAPMLKGNWQGWTTFDVVPSKPILTTLQIYKQRISGRGEYNPDQSSG